MPRQETSFGGGYRPGLVTITDPTTGQVEWLASENYIVKRAGITLSAAGVDADENGRKIVKGGTVLAKLTGTADVGKYVPYDPDGTNGADAPAGFLFPSDVNLQFGDLTVGLLIMGSVMEARCTGLDADAKTALENHFTYQ
jgi:hypothetical protein